MILAGIPLPVSCDKDETQPERVKDLDGTYYRARFLSNTSVVKIMTKWIFDFFFYLALVLKSKIHFFFFFIEPLHLVVQKYFSVLLTLLRFITYTR